MILLTVSSFSGPYDKEKTKEHQRQWSGNQEVDANTTDTFATHVVALVPDGILSFEGFLLTMYNLFVILS